MEQKGYQIFKLSDKNRIIHAGESFLKEACEMIFGFYKGIETTYLLTDHVLRKQMLKDPKCVWKQGNMKSPIISKSTGHINLYLNQDLFGLKIDNQIYKILSDLYGTTDLVFKSHDPPILKPLKSIASPVFWSNKKEYKALLCCSGGSIVQLIPGIQNEEKFCQQDKLKFLPVEKLGPHNWETIPLEPGDLLVYDSRLPFQTLGNKSKIPFLAMPINLVPRKECSKEELEFNWNQVLTKKFGDWMKNRDDNREEYQWRLEKDNFPKIDLGISLLSH